MRIAYISYEHPLGIAGGGIGTYIGQISRLMASRGHDIEVFSGHINQNQTLNIDGYILHLIKSMHSSEFRQNVLAKFSERQEAKLFDVIESPEYGADALLIKKKFPNLPLTVKLHTPSFLVSELNHDKPNLLQKLRFMLGGLLRGKITKPYWHYHKNSDIEYELFELADSVCSPSNSLKQITNEAWGEKKIKVIPNPFVPSKEILAIQQRHDTKIQVSFIGRLEKRKGILDLAKAIPMVLNSGVNVTFSFIGKPHHSPIKDLPMDEYLKKKLLLFKNDISFKGYIPYHLIPQVLNDTDICIFPSLWENFPTVCLEAMAAGKAVIGTNNGGMADMIENGESGILVPPSSPTKLAEAIIGLCNDKEVFNRVSINARKKVLNHYNGEKIGKMVEEFYENAINEYRN